MSKFIAQNDVVRKKILAGIDTVANIVKETLGPCGSNVILKSKLGNPLIVNDGVSIAKQITLEDPIENAGALLLTEAAIGTNNEVGDGTTTTCILTQALVHKGFEYIEKGENPIKLREELMAELPKIVKEIKKQSSNISAYNKLKQVATISVGGNKKYGEMVAKALGTVGVDGAVDLELSRLPETTLNIVDGYKLDRGYMSPYFINDLQKFRVFYEDCCIACSYGKIKTIEELKPLLNYAATTQKPIVLIVDEIDETVFNIVELNAMKKIFNLCIIKSPGFGFNVRDYIEDIATLTGAQLFAQNTLSIKNFEESHLGYSPKVIATADSTVILGDSSPETSSKITERIQALKNQLNTVENEHMRESIIHRISKLSTGVASIKVGATSDTEANELKLRLEDAVNATRAALRGGVVTGAGVALHHVANTLYECAPTSAAYGCLQEALRAPSFQIYHNSGGEEDPKNSNVPKNVEPKNFGFNGRTKTWADLRKAGVLDPTEVVIAAITNALSIASTVLTTHAAIVSTDNE